MLFMKWIIHHIKYQQAITVIMVLFSACDIVLMIIVLSLDRMILASVCGMWNPICMFVFLNFLFHFLYFFSYLTQDTSMLSIIYPNFLAVTSPSLAQLVERQTVVAASQQSKGRWFDSGSSDSFLFLVLHSFFLNHSFSITLLSILNDLFLFHFFIFYLI